MKTAKIDNKYCTRFIFQYSFRLTSSCENYKDNIDLQIAENGRIKHNVEQLSEKLKNSEETERKVK